MRAFPVSALLLSLSCAIAVAAGGDRDRDRPDHRPRVTFYEHADFRGGSFTLEPGQEIDNLTRARFSNGVGANDRISSIRIEGGLTVLVFRDARFRGGVLRLAHDVRNFAERERDWNDTISSIRIERFGLPPKPTRPDRDRDDGGKWPPRRAAVEQERNSSPPTGGAESPRPPGAPAPH